MTRRSAPTVSPDRVRLSSAQARIVRRTVKALQGSEFAEFGDTMVALLAEPVPTVPSVVVVGEVKRGKSTLVNALAGDADLVPSGLEVVTAGFVRVTPPQEALPDGATRLVFADGSEREVDPIEARRAIVDGETGSESDPPLVGAVLARMTRHLREVALVDTPGIAGLARSHTELATMAAAGGSVLLFVTDAGQVFTSPELEFLAEVSSKVDQVVFALTKIDSHPATFHEVMGENRQLLRTHAPRFADAPICPVSAGVALEVLDLEGDDVADLEEYTGIAALAAVLRRTVARPDGLVFANALRSGLTGVDRLIERRERTIVAIESGPEKLSELDALVARLQDLQEQGDRWSLDLQSDSSVLRADVLHRASQRLVEVRQRWTEVAHERRKDNPEKITEQVAAELAAELRIVVTESIESFLAGFTVQAEQLFAGIGRDLHDCVRLDADVEALAMGDVAAAELPGGLDPALAGTAMIGASAGGLVAGLIVPAVIAPVFTLAAGAAWYVVNYRSRRGQSLERLIISTVQSSITRAETHLRFVIDRARTVVLRDLTIAFRYELRAALETAKADVEVARRSAAETPARRKQERDNETRHLAALRAHRAEATELIGEATAGTFPAGATSDP